MEFPTNYRTLSSTSPHGLQHNLPPMRLWQKAKRLGIWNPMDIDLTQDKIDWQGLNEHENGDLTRFYDAAYMKISYDELPTVMNRLETDQKSTDTDVRRD